MARPLYIVCAQSWSVDQDSGLTSLFHIMEGFTVSRRRPQPADEAAPDGVQIATVDMMRIVCVAVWMRTDEDPEGQEYEYEMAVTSPNGERRVVTQGTFAFTKLFHRLAVDGRLPVHRAQPGFLVFDSRMRRVGDTDWLSQDYPVQVTVSDETQDGEAGAQQ